MCIGNHGQRLIDGGLDEGNLEQRIGDLRLQIYIRTRGAVLVSLMALPGHGKYRRLGWRPHPPKRGRYGGAQVL